MLAVFSGAGMKIEVTDYKMFRFKLAESQQEKGDPPYSGKSHYVDDNTWCKNVRFGACHYVDENTGT
jgi:hypothetical protein